MKEIIKELEREKNELELKIIKLGRAISELKEIEEISEAIPEKKKGGRTKWNSGIIKFISDNLDKTNDEIAEMVNKKFGLNASPNSISVQKAKHNMRMKKGEVKSRKKHKCEECRERTWEAWYKGKQLCKRCFDIKTKGERSVKMKENKDSEGEDDNEIDLVDEE